MQQPNFQEIFFQTFVEHRKAIAYRVRGDSNFPHDVQFLNSLIHDSRFELKDIRTEKRTLVVPLTRARWEVREEVSKNNLPKTSAVLTFGRVKSVRWIIGDVQRTPPFFDTLVDAGDSISSNTRCEIDSFFVGESTNLGKDGDIEVILRGYPRHWQLRILLPAEGWSISLADVPAPNEKI